MGNGRKSSLLRRLLRGAGVIVLLAGAGAGAVVVWLAERDPLAALPVAAGAASVEEQRVEQVDGRQWRRLVLSDPVVGRISLIVSLPDPLPARRLPIVVLLGGIKMGAESVRYMPAPGMNAIVGYDWPIDRDVPAGALLSGRAFDLYGQVLQVPGQVVASIDWLAAQPWADSERISLLGFSLGALAAPAVQRLAEARGRPIGWTVIAYGGAPLGALLAADPSLIPAPYGPFLGPAIGLVLRPLEPTAHLPHLSGRFLAIGASDEDIIPAAAATRLHGAIPEPKTITVVDGGHIATNRRGILDEAARITNAWLIEQQAINPP